MAVKKNKRTHGGPRKGSGRKPVEDKKIMVALYIESSIINAFGGVEEIRSACYSFLKSRIASQK